MRETWMMQTRLTPLLWVICFGAMFFFVGPNWCVKAVRTITG